MSQAIRIASYSMLSVVIVLAALILASYFAFVVLDVLYEERL